jgi:hypothetical protein
MGHDRNLSTFGLYTTGTNGHLYRMHRHDQSIRSAEPSVNLRYPTQDISNHLAGYLIFSSEAKPYLLVLLICES